MGKLVSIILLIVALPFISYAEEYSTNYNVVLNDENDIAIMRIICIGLGSQPIGDDTQGKNEGDKECTYFHMAFENLSDKPITVEKRTMSMAYFNYEGEFLLNADGTYQKDTDIQRNIAVNWRKMILPDHEIQYGDFPLCRPRKDIDYHVMMLEVHLLWNDKKYYMSFNLPSFDMEKNTE